MLNSLYSYFKLLIVNSSTTKFKQKLYQIIEYFGEVKIENEKTKENYMYMTKYNFWERWNRDKPPRTHHCSYCNRWVLRLDHHWYIIGQWIGFGNIKQFTLFTLYTFIDKAIWGFWLLYTFTHYHFGGSDFINHYSFLFCF